MDEKVIYAKHLLDPKNSNVVAEGYVTSVDVRTEFDGIPIHGGSYSTQPKFRASIEILSYNLDVEEVEKIRENIMPITGLSPKKVLIVVIEG
jgi:hypothetical protein